MTSLDNVVCFPNYIHKDTDWVINEAKELIRQFPKDLTLYQALHIAAILANNAILEEAFGCDEFGKNYLESLCMHLGGVPGSNNILDKLDSIASELNGLSDELLEIKDRIGD
jgi:hypothetical protein